MAKGENVPCIITGRTVYFSEALLQKKSKKFGSIENFRNHYVCVAARKILREGYTVQQTREHLKEGQHLPIPSDTVLRNLDLFKPRKHKQKQLEVKQEKLEDPEYQKKIEEARKKEDNLISTWPGYVEWISGGPNGIQVRQGGTCQRPDIRVRNNNYCEKFDDKGIKHLCPLYEHCLVTSKKISR